MRILVFLYTSLVLLFFGHRALAYKCYTGEYIDKIVTVPQTYCTAGRRSLNKSNRQFNLDLLSATFRSSSEYLLLYTGDCERTLIKKPVLATSLQIVKTGRYYSTCALIQTN